jgi:hypothetical protein
MDDRSLSGTNMPFCGLRGHLCSRLALFSLAILLGSSAENDYLHSFEQNRQIYEKGEILEIEKIQLQLSLSIR